jgi:hypothetical protein
MDRSLAGVEPQVRCHIRDGVVGHGHEYQVDLVGEDGDGRDGVRTGHESREAIPSGSIS